MINSGTNIKTDEINDAVAAVGRRMPKPDKPKFDFAIFEHEGCGTYT